ncbi:MAG TPA: PLP-dependent aminotransferase family protein [Actinocrinis sp.]|nr:PLP-dependent aminotransferase family protein [Actinocrinis sp.]
MTTTLALHELHGSLADPLLDEMTFLNEVTTRYPNAVSFAPGRPYEGFFEPEDLHDCLDAFLGYLRKDLGYDDDQVRAAMFQYGRTKGLIHELIARTVANDEGIVAAPDDFVVTVGAQEGMLLTLRALCADRRDVVLVSSPCYIGITGVARLLDIETVAVPEREDWSAAGGPDPDVVAAVAHRLRAEGKRPRAFYVVPDFANPSGASMPVEARRRLLETAAREQLLVIEDNPYGFFARLPESPLPTLKSLDRDAQVVYLGSFAKTCLPGARVGYVIADQRVVAPGGRRSRLADQLAKIKSMTTVNTPSLSQAVIGGMLVRHGFRLRAANAAATAFYGENLRTLLAGLDRIFPAAERARLGLRWNTPGGGFFVQMSVPFLADASAMERCARDYGVLWTPMAGFYPDGGGERRLRLSCSYLTPDRIVEGVRRLAAFIFDETLAHGGDDHADP